MAYEQRDNNGSIFRNNRKENDKQPDLSGSGMVNGKEVWVSGWRKIDKNGDEWISLAFKDKEPRRDAPAREEQPQKYEDRRDPPANRPAPKPDFDDSVPF